MGKISSSTTNFKSAEYIYSKIKREFKSFGGVNLLDDADFPLYTAEVLKRLGAGVYKEEDAFLFVRNGKACLPKDLGYIFAAYKCKSSGTEFGGKHFQNQCIFENDITCEILRRNENCEINCECPDKIIERVTIKQFVNDGDWACQNFHRPTLLKLSPNVREHCSEDCPNLFVTCSDEITINNGCLFTNFKDAHIYLQYYAFPQDKDGLPMIPDVIEVEKAIEWYIKWQILLNYWLVDDLQNALAKWQKAEAEFEKWYAEAKYINKLPSFNKMVNSIRNKRRINSVAFFSQMDNKRQ